MESPVLVMMVPPFPPLGKSAFGLSPPGRPFFLLISSKPSRSPNGPSKSIELSSRPGKSPPTPPPPPPPPPPLPPPAPLTPPIPSTPPVLPSSFGKPGIPLFRLPLKSLPSPLPPRPPGPFFGYKIPNSVTAGRGNKCVPGPVVS